MPDLRSCLKIFSLQARARVQVRAGLAVLQDDAKAAGKEGYADVYAI